jgi:hypothetical protein
LEVRTDQPHQRSPQIHEHYVGFSPCDQDDLSGRSHLACFLSALFCAHVQPPEPVRYASRPVFSRDRIGRSTTQKKAHEDRRSEVPVVHNGGRRPVYRAAKLQLAGLESIDRVAVAKIESQIRSLFDYELIVIGTVLKVSHKELIAVSDRSLRANLPTLCGARLRD